MSKRILIAITIIAALALSALGNFIAPKKAGSECKLVGDDGKFTYFKIDPKSPAEWSAVGPGYVRLFVRGYAGKTGDFQLLIDGKEYKRYGFSEKPSAKYKIEVGKSKPVEATMARVISIKLPKGKHSIEMRSGGDLFARMVAVPKKPSSIAPEQYDKSLSLINGDTKTTYYSATAQKPVVVKFNGSGTLTVWARLGFAEGMKGTQHFTVVAETAGGKQIRTKFSTSISGTSVWENDGKAIPSKAMTFTLPLSRGENIIKLWGEDTAAKYCAFRFSVKR